MFHVFHVTYQVSHVTCHMSFVHFFLQSGRVSLWRVCYQRGLPRLVFRLFLIKNALIPHTYLFQHVGIEREKTFCGVSRNGQPI